MRGFDNFAASAGSVYRGRAVATRKGSSPRPALPRAGNQPSRFLGRTSTPIDRMTDFAVIGGADVPGIERVPFTLPSKDFHGLCMLCRHIPSLQTHHLPRSRQRPDRGVLIGPTSETTQVVDRIRTTI